MKLGTFEKQPGEKRKYGVSYKDALGAGDSVIGATVDVTPPAELSASAEIGADYVNVTCSGGVDGTKYKVTVTVTSTDTNEIFEDELFIKVREI